MVHGNGFMRLRSMIQPSLGTPNRQSGSSCNAVGEKKWTRDKTELSNRAVVKPAWQCHKTRKASKEQVRLWGKSGDYLLESKCCQRELIFESGLQNRNASKFDLRLMLSC